MLYLGTEEYSVKTQHFWMPFTSRITNAGIENKIVLIFELGTKTSSFCLWSSQKQMAIGLNTLITGKWKQAGRTVHHPQHFLQTIRRYCLPVAKLTPRAKKATEMIACSPKAPGSISACLCARRLGFVCRHETVSVWRIFIQKHTPVSWTMHGRNLIWGSAGMGCLSSWPNGIQQNQALSLHFGTADC